MRIATWDSNDPEMYFKKAKVEANTTREKLI